MSQESRIAVLEKDMKRVEARLGGMDESLKTIASTLAEISGGKKALWALCSLIAMLIAGAVGVVTIVKFALAKLGVN